jgi:ferritin-like protein
VVGDSSEGEPSIPAAAADGERSRRQLLRGGGTALGGAALLLTGCTSKVKTPSHVPISPKTPGVEHDVKALNALLQLEYLSIAAYTQCIPLLPQPAPPSGSKSTPPPAPKQPSNKPPPPLVLMVPLSYTAAQTFQTHELAHVRELTGFIRQAGGKAHKPAAFYDLGEQPTTRKGVLELLHKTEEKVISGYLGMLETLTPTELRGAAAAIMANHAQHSTIIRLELGLAPTPSAFLSRPE